MKTVFIRPAFLATTLFLAAATGGLSAAPASPPAEPSSTSEADKGKALKRFDSNKDGKLDEKERAKARKQGERLRKGALRRYDADADGKLNESERSAAFDDMMKRPRAVKRFDTDGDGQVSEAEKAEARQRIEEHLGQRASDE